jgi:hypothetical protein
MFGQNSEEWAQFQPPLLFGDALAEIKTKNQLVSWLIRRPT